MSSAIHISGIRVGHVHAPDRGVRVNRPQHQDGPIEWGDLARLAGIGIRDGRGHSGLTYRVRKQKDWRVTVVMGQRRELEIGSARMEDHAMALAGMWEQAVLSGRIDMS